MQTQKKKQNWNDTDYDIPKFSYKSAFLIFGVTFILTCLTIYITNNSRWAIITVLSLSVSITTAYSRYFIDTDRKLCFGFYRLLIVLAVSCFVILSFVQF